MKNEERRKFLKLIGLSTSAIILPSKIIADEKDSLDELSSLLGHKYNISPEKIITSLDEDGGFLKLSKEEQRFSDKLLKVEIERIKIVQKRIMKEGDKNIFMYNRHTGEMINEIFWAEGKYVPENLKKINDFMRDFRENKSTTMSIASIESIYNVSKLTKKGRPLMLNSGYRTKKSNKKVGGARRSKHLTGKAIDFSLDSKDNTSLSSIKKYLLSSHNGGLGYYPRHGFIHIDSDNKRYWRG